MNEQTQSLEALRDIRRMMQRSSRFLSLSGLSGMAAGAWALVGAWIARGWIGADRFDVRDVELLKNRYGYEIALRVEDIEFKLVMLAGAVLFMACLSAFYFTWRRARRQGLPMWDHSSRQMAIHMLIPLITGGLLILAMLNYGEWQFVAPLCLVFYGLALVNGSKYTVSDIRYLGLMEIALGLANMLLLGYGLFFWAFGFGVLHIIYGFSMWWRYERKGADDLATT
ncbi:hypothetical protein [Flaviaesturariibacter amylovorans]|uniref:Uncharacterized protein n=1 Tax=Flaviaesturariibacter amylovorans TaxID=1084520 RepID=A0ABP8GDV1_9BACT